MLRPGFRWEYNALPRVQTQYMALLGRFAIEKGRGNGKGKTKGMKREEGGDVALRETPKSLS